MALQEIRHTKPGPRTEAWIKHGPWPRSLRYPFFKDLYPYSEAPLRAFQIPVRKVTVQKEKESNPPDRMPRNLYACWWLLLAQTQDIFRDFVTFSIQVGQKGSEIGIWMSRLGISKDKTFSAFVNSNMGWWQLTLVWLRSCWVGRWSTAAFGHVPLLESRSSLFHENTWAFCVTSDSLEACREQGC